MSRQLTLSSLFAVVAMASLTLFNVAHPVGGETGDTFAATQAELPQPDLPTPGWFSN